MMENKVEYDFFNPSFGKLELDESLNCQLAYDFPEPRHFHTEDDGISIVKTTTDASDDEVDEKKDGGMISSGSLKGLETNSNTSTSVKNKSLKPVSMTLILVNKLQEKEKIIGEYKKEIEELQKKLSDRDIVINKMNFQGGSQKMDDSNEVGTNISMNENEMDNTILHEGFKPTEVQSEGNVSSIVTQDGDVSSKQNVFQVDANIADMSVKLMDLSCEEKLPESVEVASPKNIFTDRQHSNDGKPKPKKKIVLTSGKFECNVCHKRLMSKTKLKYHQWIHTDERPYPCCVCKQSFRQRTNLAEHISRLHKHSLDLNEEVFVRRPGTEGFRCCFCLQVMKSREFYQKHISKFHSDLLPMVQ